MSPENPDDTTPETVEADEVDAQSSHGAGKMPTPEEEAAADKQTTDPKVAEAYQESLERGANVEGEGQITP